ncbi:MAG: hypothetical protein HDT47_08380 [Ruminococcaceae bacterium]|nr:hypothetical protein [Oscillospiraceae bacterium]
MKKLISNILIFALMSLSLCLLSSCSDESVEEEMGFEAESDFFQYDEIEWVFGRFDVGSDGTVYAENTVKEYVENEGNITVYRGVAAYSLDGELTEKYDLGDYFMSTVAYCNRKLYLTGGKDGSYNCLVFSIDLDTKEITELYETDLSTSDGYPLCSLISNDSLYFIVFDPVSAAEVCPYESNTFQYSGLAVYCYDIKTGELKKLNIDFPAVIGGTYDGGICIYAADEKGTYFTFGENSEKIYSDMGNIRSFAVVSSKNDYVFSGISSVNHTLNKAVIGESGCSELRPDVMCSYNGIKYKSGYTFYVNTYNVNDPNYTPVLYRMKNSAYAVENKTIRAVSPTFAYDEPFGCGYKMNLTKLTDEEFALKVLSQSPDYDICVLSTRLNMSENIRDKGTFYPLNEVEDVEEYLDKCFPSVKEAALSEDGEIWMLPIELDVDVLMYNEVLCEKYGIEFGKDMSFEQLIENAEKAAKSEKSNCYALQGYLLNTNMLLQFMRAGSSFDTDEFRSFAEFSKERANYITEEYPFANLFMSQDDFFEDKENHLFTFSSFQTTSEMQLIPISDPTGIRACPLPSVTEDKRSVGSCLFISVNPTSDNLDSVLGYISALAEYLTDNNPNILFSENKFGDIPYINDLYEIYANSSVSFNVSYELYRQDYENYLAGEVTLDECIKEADRKLAAYFNE